MPTYQDRMRDVRAAESRLQDARRTQDAAFTDYMDACQKASAAFEAEQQQFLQHPIWQTQDTAAVEQQRAGLAQMGRTV